MQIDKPNFTQLPNSILDSMFEFTDAELRVVLAICRQTFGWHRESHRMSISFMEKATGLSHQGIINATWRLLEKKCIERVSAGDSFEYNLVVNNPDSQSTQLRGGSQPSLLGVVNSVERGVVNLVEIKKERDKETIKESRAAKKSVMTEAQFVESLKANPAYKGIDIAREHNKAGAWCLANRRELTRRFFVNWLNRAERPMAVTQSHVGNF